MLRRLQRETGMLSLETGLFTGQDPWHARFAPLLSNLLALLYSAYSLRRTHHYHLIVLWTNALLILAGSNNVFSNRHEFAHPSYMSWSHSMPYSFRCSLLSAASGCLTLALNAAPTYQHDESPRASKRHLHIVLFGRPSAHPQPALCPRLRLFEVAGPSLVPRCCMCMPPCPDRYPSPFVIPPIPAPLARLYLVSLFRPQPPDPPTPA